MNLSDVRLSVRVLVTRDKFPRHIFGLLVVQRKLLNVKRIRKVPITSNVRSAFGLWQTKVSVDFNLIGANPLTHVRATVDS